MTITNSDLLLEGFLTKAPARSSQSVEARINQWADVANNPELYTNGDTSPHAIRARRKVALQSLKKLIAEHPEIAKRVQSKRVSSEAA